MPSIRELTVDDLLAWLPDWGDQSLASAECFIGAIGFEDRTPSAFERWATTTDSPHPRALLVRYHTMQAESEPHRRTIHSIATRTNVVLSELTFERSTTYMDVCEYVQRLRKQVTIVLDISVMASHVFYPVFAAVLDRAGKRLLRVSYAEAADYEPTEAEWNAFRERATGVVDPIERARIFEGYQLQSTGSDDVYESGVFMGSNPGNLPARMVLVPNFSFERVQRMRNFIADRYATRRDEEIWLIGLPPDQARLGWRHDAVWEMFGSPNHRYAVSTLEYKQMLLVLHRIWEDANWSESLVIGALGSKAQHLGTALFLRMHPEVGLVMSEPSRFVVGRYSTGVGPIRSLELGRVDSLVERLTGWNRLEFNWQSA